MHSLRQEASKVRVTGAATEGVWVVKRAQGSV